MAAALPGSRCGAALRDVAAAWTARLAGTRWELKELGRSLAAAADTYDAVERAARQSVERIVRRPPVTVAGGSLTLSVRDIRASRPQSLRCRQQGPRGPPATGRGAGRAGALASRSRPTMVGCRIFGRRRPVRRRRCRAGSAGGEHRGGWSGRGTRGRPPAGGHRPGPSGRPARGRRGCVGRRRRASLPPGPSLARSTRPWRRTAPASTSCCVPRCMPCLHRRAGRPPRPTTSCSARCCHRPEARRRQ